MMYQDCLKDTLEANNLIVIRDLSVIQLVIKKVVPCFLRPRLISSGEGFFHYNE